MSDLRVTITVKNAILLRAMEVEGFDSAAALARAAKVSLTTVYHYLNLKLAPYSPDGTLRPSIERIAKTLRRLPEDLFPAPFLRRALETNKVTREIDSEALPQLMAEAPASIAYDPLATMEHAEARQMLAAAISKLPERDALVLRVYYGLDDNDPKTLDQTAKILGVTRERVRQILLRGERQLKHQFGVWHPESSKFRATRAVFAPILGGA